MFKYLGALIIGKNEEEIKLRSADGNQHYYGLKHILRRIRDSSVGRATDYGLDGRGIGV
jgi:hypothetical protein